MEYHVVHFNIHIPESTELRDMKGILNWIASAG